MKVKELIGLLLKIPKDSIILADIGQKEESEITDVLIGGGTIKGFVYLKIEPYEELKELERLAEIGKATEWLLNECNYKIALAEQNQIDCTQGGLYITDTESIIDLFNGLN